MNPAARLYYRVYQDVLMPSRLGEYRELLRKLLESGYAFKTITEAASTPVKRLRLCLLRNDVDTDPSTAARMFEIDRGLGIRATYYFRLSTIDRTLTERIAAQGGEVGYHFEEIATFAKRFGLTTEPEIDAHLEEIRELFRSNFGRFESSSGVRPRSIASHGDFANRRIGVANHRLLTPALLNELGIVAHAYDDNVYRRLGARFSDAPAPVWWHPSDPAQSLAANLSAMTILVHPRQWQCSPVVNIRVAAARLGEEAAWRWRRAMRKRSAHSLPTRTAPSDRN